jgi:TM2 domain-containing membrane protein YozV
MENYPDIITEYKFIILVKAKLFELFYFEKLILGALPMANQGSAGNVIAALCSFFIPGLGQLIQGRPFAALFYFVIDIILWLFLLGWLMHIFACLDAAWYKG